MNDKNNPVQDTMSQFHIGQLRHLYAQMVNGHVTNLKTAADGLLAPAIRHLEKQNITKNS